MRMLEFLTYLLRINHHAARWAAEAGADHAKAPGGFADPIDVASFTHEMRRICDEMDRSARVTDALATVPGTPHAGARP